MQEGHHRRRYRRQGEPQRWNRHRQAQINQQAAPGDAAAPVFGAVVEAGTFPAGVFLADAALYQAVDQAQ